MATITRLFTFSGTFPTYIAATLSLLRKRVLLSRELSDDVVRVRGRRVCRSRENFEEVEVSLFDEMRHGLTRSVRYNRGLERSYVNGKKHGIDRGWHETGTRQFEITWVNGERHGFERWWYKEGTKQSESAWVNNKRHGFTREWDENGVLVYENRFIDGKRQAR